MIPLAAQLSVGTDELFASIATLTKQGIGTAQAVTGLKAAFSNVIKPTKEATDAAEAIGLDFSAAALESKGFAGFLADVREKTGGNTEVMAQLFGSVEALNTVMALTGEQGMKDFSKGLDAMAGSAGATDKAYETMMGGLNAGLSKLKTSFQNFGISLGNIILPFAEKAVGWLQKGVTWATGLSDGVKKTAVAVAGFAAGLGPALTISGKLLGAFSPVIPVVAAIGGALALVYNRSERLQAITAQFKADGIAAYDGLKAGLSTYQEQVANGATWTSALSAAIQSAFGENTGTRISRMASRILSGFKTVGSVLRSTKDGMGEFIASLIDGQGVTTSFDEGLQAAFSGKVPQQVRDLQAGIASFIADIRADYADGGIVSVMRGIGTKIGDALHDGLSLTKERLTDGAKTAMKWLGDAYRSGAVQRGIGTLTRVSENILDKLTPSKSTIIEKAGALLKGLGTALGSDEAKEKLGDLADIAAAIATRIASDAGSWKLTAGKLISDLVKQLTDNGFLSSALEGIGKVVTGIAEGLGAASGNIATAAESIIQSLAESITSGGFIERTFTTAGELVAKIAGIISNSAPAIVSAAGRIGVALINGLASLDWATIFTSAGMIVTTLATVLAGVAGNVAGAATDIGIALVNGIAGIDWPTIFTTAGDVITAIAGVLGGMASNVASAATDIGIALINGLSGLDWKSLFTTAGDVVTAIGTTIAANATPIASAALDLGLKLLEGLAALDWAGISQSLAEACGKLVQAIVDWFEKPENVNRLGDAAGSIVTQLAEGVARNLANPDIPSLLNPPVWDIDLTPILHASDPSYFGAEWAQSYFNALQAGISNETAITRDQLANAIALVGEGYKAEVSALSPELEQQASTLFKSLYSSANVNDLITGFASIGYRMTDELAMAIGNGQVSITDTLRALSVGMDQAMILSMSQSELRTYLNTFFTNTGTEITNLLQSSATDWGRVFGQAIPDGATVGLENGMYTLRGKTGEVIKLVSAVDAQTTVATGNKDTAQAGIDAASQTLDDGVTTVGTSAQGVADAVTTPLESLPTESQAQAAAMLAGINTAIATGTPEAIATIETAADAVTDKAAAILNGAKGQTIGADYVGGIATGVRTKESALLTGVQSAAARAAAAAAAILTSSTGYSMGQNMVQGIINGVNAMTGTLAAKMRSMANSAVAAFRNSLDMHSPSRVLMADGTLMAQSIGLGVTRGSEAAIRSMVALASDMRAVWDTPAEPVNMTGNPHSTGGTGKGSGLIFNFYGAITVREEADIQKVAAALAEEFVDQRRGGGY